MTGRFALIDFWDCDPLPTILAPYGTMSWWREYSLITLAARRG